MKEIDTSDSLKIILKLFPKERGGIVGTSSGLTYCKKGDSILKTFFNNADMIPYEKSIYKKYLQNIKIEKIR